MLGASGETIDLLDPSNTPIFLPTILHALGGINRFGAHGRRFYSVLEHSILVGEIAFHLARGDRMARAMGVMHDAHKTYTGDVAPPIKQLIGSQYDHLERAWMWYVRGRLMGRNTDFARWLWHNHEHVIKRADRIAYVAEKRALMPLSGPACDVARCLSPEDREYAKSLAPDLYSPAGALSSKFLDALAAAGLEPVP